MLERVLDDTHSAEVRRVVPMLTFARFAANSVYRYAPPFIATIARGLDVDIADIGVALAIAEASGLASPLVGRLVDRIPRRVAMAGGMLGMAVGAIVAGASTGIVWFAVGLLVLALTKIVFDVGLIAWTADHVPYERRGRVVGVIETSWALGLLIGVSSLGVLTALTSWRWAYIAGAAGVLVAGVLLYVRVGNDPPRQHISVAAPTGHLAPGGWLAILGMFGLMGAAQSLFVTFGPWLEDVFGFGNIGLAAVTFGIGGLELAASTTSAARTDRWGKERSVVRGTMLMIPCGLLLAAFDETLAVGLITLGIFIAGFEFAIVSTIPIGAELVPGSPGRGVGTMVAWATVGRAAVAIPATRLYENHGLAPAALMAVGFATIASVAMTWRRRAYAR